MFKTSCDDREAEASRITQSRSALNYSIPSSSALKEYQDSPHTAPMQKSLVSRPHTKLSQLSSSKQTSGTHNPLYSSFDPDRIASASVHSTMRIEDMFDPPTSHNPNIHRITSKQTKLTKSIISNSRKGQPLRNPLDRYVVSIRQSQILKTNAQLEMKRHVQKNRSLIKTML